MSNRVNLSGFKLTDSKIDKSPIISKLEVLFGSSYPNDYAPKPSATTLQQLLDLLNKALEQGLILELPEPPKREFTRRFRCDITTQAYTKADGVALFSAAFCSAGIPSEVTRLAAKLDSITLTKSLQVFAR